jgi:hypothetical protein
MHHSVHLISIELGSVLPLVEVGNVPNPRFLRRAVEAISNFVVGLLQEFCVGVLVAFGHVDRRIGAGSMLKASLKYYSRAPPNK